MTPRLRRGACAVSIKPASPADFETGYPPKFHYGWKHPNLRGWMEKLDWRKVEYFLGVFFSHADFLSGILHGQLHRVS